MIEFLYKAPLIVGAGILWIVGAVTICAAAGGIWYGITNWWRLR